MPFVSGGHIWLLAILLIIVLIIWGPGKLPDVGSGMGRAIREFRKASNDTREEFAKATRPDETPAALRHDPAQPTPTSAPPIYVPTPPMPAPPVAPGGAGTEVPVQPAPLGGGTLPGPPPEIPPR